MSNRTNSTLYQDFEDSSATIVDDDSEYSDKEEHENKPSMENKIQNVSLKKEDIVEIYDDVNIPSGVRKENNKLLMGNSNVTLAAIDDKLNKKYLISVDENQYELTPGLRELLFCKKPNLAIVSCEDQIVYKDMLNYTSAHKKGYNPDERIKGDKSNKYRKIIKPLFEASSPSHITEPKLGCGIQILKKYKRNTDLVYWDDPNELVERLKLLVASKNAGNNNHNNEIISIIEELKEAGIISQ
jgi:hypothetical protein